MAEPFSAFPSWFLRIECDRCGKVQMVNEAHARWRDRSESAEFSATFWRPVTCAHSRRATVR